MTANPVVSKYAMALFNVAMDKKVTGDLFRYLKALKNLFSENPAFAGFLLNPEIPAKKKMSVIQKITDQGDASALFHDFLDLLFSRGRMALIPDITDAYEELYRESKGEIDVTVFTPFSLTEDQKKTLQAFIQKARPGKSVVIREKEDKKLIGGIKLELEGRTYDGTAAGWLKQSEHVLKGE